ncbi:hypothetical protein ACFWBB_01800 [Streptomyces sp. NPDC060000]|uniref:DUF6197 family protein n=1 Tax=Streptomyces sp. NPDC060000 TaxID=3347031 RepID=UPI00367EA72A
MGVLADLIATVPPELLMPASPRPATAPPQPAARVTPAPAVTLGLEARLAAVDAAMTLRLEEAAVAHEVRTAHLAVDPIGLADVITVPLTPTPEPPAPATYRTPAAALLERAHHRMQAAGWCAGTLADDDGAVCLIGALRAEADGDQDLVVDASAILLEAIQRKFHDESVPAFNDRQHSGAVPARMLLEAAGLADARGR